MSQRISRLQSLCLAILLGSVGAAPVLAKAFELGVQEKQYLDSAPPLSTQSSSYPAPQMVQPAYAPPSRQLNSGASENAQRPPIKVSTQVSHTLPPGFLGSWQVSGGRTKVEAADPAFQQQAANAFQTQTSDTWTISGGPQQGYSISASTGVSFQLWVDKVANGVAFVRYQHPIKNTVAQEAVVMQLGNGGATFSGLETYLDCQTGARSASGDTLQGSISTLRTATLGSSPTFHGTH